MSKYIPASKPERIQWFSERAEVWNTNATQLGLTTTETINLVDAKDGALSAEASLNTAKQALKNAQQDYDNSIEAMTELGSGLLKVIKAKALKNPNLYILAQIPPPSDPSSKPAPDMPTELKANVLNCGNVELTWKATGSGNFYTVYRRLPSESSFKWVGTIGAKKLTDTTLPPGETQATYIVVAQRGELSSSPSEPVVVQLGCNQAPVKLELKQAA